MCTCTLEICACGYGRRGHVECFPLISAPVKDGVYIYWERRSSDLRTRILGPAVTQYLIRWGHCLHFFKFTSTEIFLICLFFFSPNLLVRRHFSRNHHGIRHLHSGLPVQDVRWERWILQHPEQGGVAEPGDRSATQLCQGASQSIFLNATLSCLRPLDVWSHWDPDISRLLSGLVEQLTNMLTYCVTFKHVCYVGDTCRVLQDAASHTSCRHCLHTDGLLVIKKSCDTCLSFLHQHSRILSLPLFLHIINPVNYILTFTAFLSSFLVYLTLPRIFAPFRLVYFSMIS